jgi:hypothetical protein
VAGHTGIDACWGFLYLQSHARLPIIQQRIFLDADNEEKENEICQAFNDTIKKIDIRNRDLNDIKQLCKDYQFPCLI